MSLGYHLLLNFSDLPDGGSSHFAETVREIKNQWVWSIVSICNENIISSDVPICLTQLFKYD